jgi:uncharacterized alpha-E superfamily protein
MPQFEMTAAEEQQYGATLNIWQALRLLQAWHPLVTYAQQFVGTAYVTMTHNEAWHFARLGRLLERADKTSRILDVKYFFLLPEVSDVGTAYDEVQWAALLKSASAFEMYRKRWGLIAPARVVEFLALDPKFQDRQVSITFENANASNTRNAGIILFGTPGSSNVDLRLATFRPATCAASSTTTGSST